MDCLAVVEARSGALRKVSYEVVTAARQLAQASGGGEVHALLIGGPGIGERAAELGRYGADVVVLVEHAALERYRPEVFAATMTARLGAHSYRAACVAASAQGRDLAPRVAASIGRGLLADVVEFEVAGDTIRAQHPVYIGKATATLRLEGSPALLSLRPGAITPAEATPPRAPRVERVEPAREPATARVVVTELVERAAAELDLGEAPVIVSGGRGLKGPENFRLVEELAAAFGNAAVGATRAVTDDGWRPATDQIGQTGRLVSPVLYVAVGISGAIQHLAGMRTSRVIVAINRDREAPIMKVADYAIVGDLFEIVPRLTEEIRKVRATG
ncbi:MAG: electron transfer flavoprotein subunit alpha/FixB family protein [Gemmatimonadales bacterium]